MAPDIPQISTILLETPKPKKVPPRALKSGRVDEPTTSPEIPEVSPEIVNPWADASHIGLPDVSYYNFAPSLYALLESHQT